MQTVFGDDVEAEAEFNPKGNGYDYATAKKYGMTQGEDGHWGSRVELPESEAKKIGLPAGSGIMLKGSSHETWDKALAGEESAGFNVIPGKDGRFYSIPKSASTVFGDSVEGVAPKLSAKISAVDPRSSQARILSNTTAPQLVQMQQDKAQRDQLEQMVVDSIQNNPETLISSQEAPPSPQIDQDEKTLKLFDLQQQQAALQKQSEELTGDLGSGKVASAGAGLASIPVGLVSLANLLAKSGVGDKAFAQSPVGAPQSQEMLSGLSDKIERVASANPTTAGIASAIGQAETMGAGPGMLLKGAAGASIPALISQGLYKEAALQAAKQGTVNAGLGAAIRKATGQEITPGNIGLDVLLGGLASRGRVPDANAPLIQEPSAISTPSSGVPPVILEPKQGIVGQALSAVAESSPVRGVRNAAKRASINSAETKSAQQAIKALPPLARDAVENGVENRDVNLVVNATRTEKALFKEMLDDAKSYSENRKGEDPTMLVGQEFRKRIEATDKLREHLGRKLGETVKDLPKDLVQDASSDVLEELQKVNGLEGLKFAEDGKLDFSDTSLSSSRTKADREILQEAFNDTQDRSPFQLHRLRQELFEDLGGRKAAGMVVTETLDKGLEGIRKGLANSLERISPEYKIANRQYAQVLQPLKEIRKYFKKVDGADSDILDMKAALLGRRLTSNAQSNPDLRYLIRNMEDKLLDAGIEFNSHVDTLQEFANALSRYYDLARDTSLEGVVKNANKSIDTNLKSIALKKAGKAIQVTPAVQRKFFEDLVKKQESTKSAEDLQSFLRGVSETLATQTPSDLEGALNQALKPNSSLRNSLLKADRPALKRLKETDLYKRATPDIKKQLEASLSE